MKDESSCRKLMEHFGLSKFQVQAIANGLNTAKDSDDLFQVGAPWAYPLPVQDDLVRHRMALGNTK
jgi:hypothetical protein